MFCISCGKKISKISKFCKYCGAKQIIKKKLNKKEYETIWVCDYCGKEFKTKDESDEHELTCKKNQTKQNLFWIFIVFLGIYFLTYFISNSYAQNNGLPIRDLLQPQKWFSSEGKKDITPTPTILPIPTIKITPTSKPKTQVKTNTGNTGSQIECVGPDGKHFNTTMDECKKLAEKWGKSVDYMTNCTYSDLCVGGGGVRYVKKSECDKPCERASTGQQGNTGQKTSGNSFYCWNNAYGYAYYTSSGDQCNLDNLKSTGNKICLDTQKIKSDTCGAICKSDSNSNNAKCSQLYGNATDVNNGKYGECLNGPGGSGEIYGSCLSKCTDQYAQDLKTCSN